MTCSKAGDMLSPYLDGELQPRAAARLEAHLSGCARCRAELADLRRAVTALRTPPAAVPAEGLLTEFKLRLQQEASRPPVRVPVPLFSRLLLPAGAVAAVLLAAVAISRSWTTSTHGVRTGSLPSEPPRMAMAPSSARQEERDTLARPAGPAETAKMPADSGSDLSAALQKSEPPTVPGAASRRAAAPGAPIMADRSPGATFRPSASSGVPELRQDRGLARGSRANDADGAGSRTVRKPRPILLPPGVLEREREARKRQGRSSDTVAERPERQSPALPGRDSGPKAVSPDAGPAGSPPPGPAIAGAPVLGGPPGAPGPPGPSEASPLRLRGTGTGWVSIRIVARPEIASPEAVAPAAGESVSALSRAAADAAPPPANVPGRRQSKQSAAARESARVAPALLTAMRRPVSLIVNDVPLAELVARLGQSAEVGLSLSPQVPADTMRATADLRGLALHEALARLAEAAGLTIAPSGSGVLLRPRSGTGAAGRSALWSAEWGTAPEAGFAPPGAAEKSR